MRQSRRLINQNDAGFSFFVIPVALCALAYAAWRGCQVEREVERTYNRVSGEGRERGEGPR